MNGPIAWMVETEGGGRWVVWDREYADARNDQRLPRATVTPLIAAPPAQTIAEVREMLARFAALSAMAEHSSKSELEEADAIEARLLSIVSFAAASLRHGTGQILVTAKPEIHVFVGGSAAHLREPVS